MIQPGQVIAGKYRVDRLLGEGGMGSVWVATNLVLQKQVALKVMSDAFKSHPDWTARFFREGVAASKARHPGVVQVFDAGEHEGAPWMAMELLEGESLRDRLIREGRLSPSETVRIMGEVLDALGAVHAVGIVHRDLKPDNVFLERTPHGERAKVLDFGIAKEAEAIGSLTATGTIVGTAHYLAPEQARDSKLVDARTDLYAAGVILYECLSGQMPYDAQTVPELIAKMYTEPPRDLGQVAPDVPPGLRQVVHYCLAREPSGRPGSAQALRDALEPALGRGQTGPVSQPSPAWSQAGFAPTAAIPATAGAPAPIATPPPRATPPPVAAPVPPPRRSIWPWVVGALVLVGLLVVAPVVAVIGFGMWTAVAVMENAEGISQGLAHGALDFDLPQGARMVMLVDADGDGTEDVLGSIMRYDSGEGIRHLAAYEGNTGRRLWLSEPLGTVESHNHSIVGQAGDVLLLATGQGDVQAFAIDSGRLRWRFNVGERPERFCRAEPGSAILVTADDRRTRVMLADGTAQPDAGAGCERLMGDHVFDFSSSSAWEPPWEQLDRFDADVDVDGISEDALFGDGARTLVSGQRDSGTRIPRVGLAGGWQLDVPGVSPLSAEASSPAAIFVARDEVFLAYAMENGPHRVTALGIADGARRWDVALSQESTFDPQYVQVGATRVAVGFGGRVDVFERESGRALFHLGR